MLSRRSGCESSGKSIDDGEEKRASSEERFQGLPVSRPLLLAHMAPHWPGKFTNCLNQGIRNVLLMAPFPSLVMAGHSSRETKRRERLECLVCLHRTIEFAVAS